MKPPVRGVNDFDFVEYLVTLCNTLRDPHDSEWRRESGLNHGFDLLFWEPLVNLGAYKFPLSRHHVDWELLAEGIVEGAMNMSFSQVVEEDLVSRSKQHVHM